jgi:heparanase
MGHQTTEDQALSEQWLNRTDETLAFYRQARDKSMPGKPFWLTETGETACGGNPWAGTFLDSFRYLDQLGRLARQDVKVVMHNTLDASDYSLLDESSFEPKPNYWAALLWRRLMGTTVLDPSVANGPGLHIYAQCLRNVPGGVAVLAINTDRSQSRTVTTPVEASRYSLTAAQLAGKSVMLNRQQLKLRSDDQLPRLNGQPLKAGIATFAPVSITFLAMPNANNTACH